ncbi:MAG: hypothetical protein AB1330_00830 [Bacillota bacterium]
MKKIKKLLRLQRTESRDHARVELSPLLMEATKISTCKIPHEITVVVPRVEVREKIQTPFFTRSRETIYNSITIVIAPRAPLTGGENSGRRCLKGLPVSENP